ncbi:hypothetical protein I551_6298 [Mycobacterium ulcerans str. Harvey]|uniref:Uncharacterized protein n=1 Tax=Mycobacterium ulcerans str. Harvey TaxID=1299332 RepID=A0ABN0QR78_MYCUL|nr:hypothetical protein I551_6298 [Mycobacterium ulcerans str. Harvey]
MWRPARASPQSTAMLSHAQVRLVHFWEKFGFKPMRKGAKLVFSDHE